MTIKHLVITGGGPSGIISYGAIKKLHELGVWAHDDLKTIYATSIGGFIGFLITMKFEWDIIDDYIIERPWSNAFDSLKHDILEIIYNKGLDGEKVFSICTKPILTAKGLSADITLKQLYEVTRIELCLTTVDLNTRDGFLSEIISYKSYPDMTLNCALACTSAVPMIFKPIFYGNKCYVDGGLTNNFPLKLCIDQTKCEETEILSFVNRTTTAPIIISKTDSIVEYARSIVMKLHNKLDETSQKWPAIRNIVSLDANDVIDITTWYGFLEHKEKRQSLLDRGELAGTAFFNLNFRQETAEDSPCLV
jgi:predicted acylesterase/phospholipase RssA